LLEDVQAHLGEEIGVGEWFTVTQDRIDAFAGATDDHQWIHVDPDKAAAGPYGTTIAHGFLTLSLIVPLAPRLELPAARMAINYGVDRVRFITPVPAGSRVRARSTLMSAEDVPGGIQTKTAITMELEGSEKPAAVVEALTRFYL
jgi:acyl dehydratase